MAVSYKRLWIELAKKEMSKAELEKKSQNSTEYYDKTCKKRICFYEYFG